MIVTVTGNQTSLQILNNIPSDILFSSPVGTLAIMDRPEVETPGGWGEDQRPEAVGPSVQEPEEEVEEDVRMCVDMASLSVVRPHTQIDYYHHLVPHLSEITNSSYYWGKMDRWGGIISIRRNFLHLIFNNR